MVNVVSELQIAWMELITVGGIGVILLVSGVVINAAAKRRTKSCTERIEGIVVRHGFPGEGRMYPILEYIVDRKCYQAKKKFRGVKVNKLSGIPVSVQGKAYEDEKGWLHVKIGSVSNLKQLAEQLWPIGSKMTVCYDPGNPRKCYVDRPVSGGFAPFLFIAAGMAVMLLSVLIFFLIQL